MNIPYFDYSKSQVAVQPRGGRSTIRAQRNLWLRLSEAGADILPLTIDSKTRLGMIKDASSLYDQATKTNVETLNGFPLLSANIGEVKELMNEFRSPKSLRHGTPVPYELIKRALQVGVSEIEGGPLSYTLPYSRDISLTKALDSWEASERECHRFQNTHGSEIIREHFGVLTACLVHPLQAILSNALEGVFTLMFGGGKPMASFGATGCEYQDLATIRAYKKVIFWVEEYLENNQFDSLIAFHHWMGPFPKTEQESISIIEDGSRIAILTKSNKVVAKTIDEAKGIPTNEANASAVKLVRAIINKGTEGIEIPKTNQILVEEEAESLYLESTRQLRLILKNVTKLNIKEIIKNSVAHGYIDPAFAPHVSCLRKTKVLRARDGSLRISSDYRGRCDDIFVKREAKFLGKFSNFTQYSADELKLQITHPILDTAHVK